MYFLGIHIYFKYQYHGFQTKKYILYIQKDIYIPRKIRYSHLLTELVNKEPKDQKWRIHGRI